LKTLVDAVPAVGRCFRHSSCTYMTLPVRPKPSAGHCVFNTALMPPALQKANASFFSKLKLPLERFFPGGKKKIAETQDKLSDSNEKIVGELKKSYWADYNAAKGETGGKTFDGTQQYAGNQGGEVPALQAKSLAKTAIVSLPDDFSGRTTLLLVGCRAYAQPQLDAYRKAFEAAASRTGARRAQVIECWFVERMAFKWMSGVFEKSLLKQIHDPTRREQTCVVTDGVEEFMKTMGVTNTIIGHAYLVDGRGRIRWKANGEATHEEIVALNDGLVAALPKPTHQVGGSGGSGGSGKRRGKKQSVFKTRKKKAV